MEYNTKEKMRRIRANILKQEEKEHGDKHRNIETD